VAKNKKKQPVIMNSCDADHITAINR